MERAEWLKQMRRIAEDLYDQTSPDTPAKFEQYANETQREYLQNFLGRLPPHGTLLSAACGAGRYDGLLLDAGHSMVGIDQSAGMLAQAKQRCPGARYEKMGLQEMAFQEAFDGAICIDAMEHICPEDWPGILKGFRAALKPGGVLYITVELAEASKVEAAYQRAKARGLPAVPGELADQVDEAYAQVQAVGLSALAGELADVAVYHYYPALEQVRTWIGQAGLKIEEEGTGSGYEHFVMACVR